MGSKKSHDEHFEQLMIQLAESMLELSNKVIIAEIGEIGADANQEAEQTHIVLLRASQTFENLYRRMSRLGHTMSTSHWRREQGEYTNHCEDCGSLVIFTIGSGEVRGQALYEPCSASNHFRVAKQGVAH